MTPFSLILSLNFFKREPHKMVKHTQTIRWLFPRTCLSVLDHFVDFALKGLKYSLLNSFTSQDREITDIAELTECFI